MIPSNNSIIKRDFVMSLFKKLITLSLSLICLIFSEEGSISGKVTSNGQGLAGANVFLKGTTLGAVTDSSGNYSVNYIPVGKYIIRADYIGFKSKEKEVYISINQASTEMNESSIPSFSEKLGIVDEDIEDITIKDNKLSDINFELEPSVLEIDQVVISASRREEKIIDAVANITAVSNGKIRRYGGGDLGFALKTAKGVDVYQAGLGRTNINARGFMSTFNGRFIAMVDGISLNDPIFATYSTRPIPIMNHDIERVEVVFGPSSAIYGPNAHNGLMNIITQHPRDVKSNLFLIETGPNEYNSQNIRFVKNYSGVGGFKFSLMNRYYLDWDPMRFYGQDLDWNNTYEENEIIRVFDTREELEIRERIADFNSYYTLTNGIELGFGHSHSNNKGYVPYDVAAVIGEPIIDQTYFKVVSPLFFFRYTRINNKLRDTYGLDLVWNQNVQYQDSLSRMDIINNFDKVSYNTITNKFEFQINNRFMGFDVTSGLDYNQANPKTGRGLLNDSGLNPSLNIRFPVLVESDTMDYIKNDISITEYGAYTQMSKLFNYDLKVLGALRYDKHSYYDGQVSPRIALQWNGLDAGHIRLSFNKAFQTPSLYNLHFLFHALPIGGNPVPIDYEGNLIHPTNQEAWQQWGEESDTDGDGIVSDGELFDAYLNSRMIQMEAVVMGNKDGFVINDSISIPGLKIEEVESYEFAIKKLMFGKLFVDASFFYSRYYNFKSPLQRMNNPYPFEEPWDQAFVTEANGEARPGNEWILSFISLDGIKMYGLDIYLKYLLNKSRDELTFGYSYYGTGNIDGEKSNSSLEKGNDFFVGNSLLRALNDQSFNPYTDLVFFNAPEHKIFLTYLNNSLLKKGYFELTANYKSKFDFISGSYTFSDTDTKTSFFHPNPYYENTGSIGGNLIFDLMAGYSVANNIDLNLRLNNITDRDPVILVGTPPPRRSYILGLTYTF